MVEEDQAEEEEEEDMGKGIIQINTIRHMAQINTLDLLLEG